jgi:hypothetical protein
MASAPFKKLGNDRFSQNVANSINSPSTNLVTGNIGKGKAYDVEFAASTSETVYVGARRTGALIMSIVNQGHTDYKWAISGGYLTVDCAASSTATLSFWVF